jgi:CheY-like chemotaxis protein
MGATGQYKKEDFTIFIVEDDYIYNKLATLITEEIIDTYNCPDINFEVVSFTSAQECLSQIDRNPKLIILDYFFEINDSNNIPTAVDVLEKIRQHNKDTEVIVVSSLTEIMKIVKLMELGAQHYILKDQESLSRLRFTIKNLIKDFLEKHYLS